MANYLLRYIWVFEKFYFCFLSMLIHFILKLAFRIDYPYYCFKKVKRKHKFKCAFTPYKYYISYLLFSESLKLPLNISKAESPCHHGLNDLISSVFVTSREPESRNIQSWWTDLILYAHLDKWLSTKSKKHYIYIYIYISTI